MTDTNVIKLSQPGTFTDSLTEILRDGARALLTRAVETEVSDFLGRYADLKTEAGHQRVVRHPPHQLAAFLLHALAVLFIGFVIQHKPVLLTKSWGHKGPVPNVRSYWRFC